MNITEKSNEKHGIKILSWFFNNVRKDTLHNVQLILKEFTYPIEEEPKQLSRYQLQKKGIAASSVSDLITRLKEKELIKPTGNRPSKAGPISEIQLYSLTEKGFLLAGSLFRDPQLIVKSLEKIRQAMKEHPIGVLALDTLKKVKVDILFVFAEEFLREVSKEEGGFPSVIPHFALLFSHRIFNKIESQGYLNDYYRVFNEKKESLPVDDKEVVDRYIKNSFEWRYIGHLQGKQLKRYIRQTKKDPNHLHIVCRACGAILKCSFNLVNLPKKCEKCGAILT